MSFQVTAQGTFNENVSLACSFIPSIPGASCAFSPSATIFPTSDLPTNMSVTVTVPATTTTGPYNVTIQATASGQQTPVTQSFTMNVTTNPTFILTEQGSFPNVNAGSTETSGPVTISSQDGFSGTVSLSCQATLDISCSVSPTSVTVPPSSPWPTTTLVINSSGLTAGTYQVTVQGVSGSITNSLIVPFTLVDYAIAGPFTLTTIPGGSVTGNYLFTEVDGYTGQIDLSCNASPLPGGQCTLTPAGPITLEVGASTPVSAAISVPAGTAVSTYTITINSHDTSGSPSHSFPTSLSVQDFALSAIAPASQNIGVGGTATYTFKVVPAGTAFSNSVALACTGAPSWSTCTVTPSIVTPGTSSIQVTVSVVTTTTTPQGTSTIAITGTSGSLTHSANSALTVANALQLGQPSGFPSTLDAGGSGTASILLTPNYTGTVSASCNSKLAGVQCSFSPANPIAINGAPITLKISVNVPNSATPQAYALNVVVSDSTGNPTVSRSLPFTIAQDYIITIGTGQTSQTITAGQSITYNLGLSPVGSSYNGSITLSCSSFPQLPGNCSNFSPNPISLAGGAQSIVMTVSTQAASSRVWPPGSKNIPWLYATWCGLGASFAFLWAMMRTRMVRLGFLCCRYALLVLALTLLFLLLSCGGGSNGTIPSVSTGTPVSYTLTISGSPASDTQPGGTSVTLIVN